MNLRVKTGVCKLTLKEGEYVKAHIIPQALTYPTSKGVGFTEFGSGRKPSRRWSSWYDQSLVIRQGEDIFSYLDDWAIKFLRRHKLIWKSWDSNNLPITLYTRLNETHGIRRIENFDGKNLRLFLLSLLWRSCATNLEAFSEIEIPNDSMEKIRLTLIGEQADDFMFFPVSLIQLSSKGTVHNHTPLIEHKLIHPMGNTKGKLIKIIRFYFDGLIIHMHFPNSHLDKDPENPMILSASSNLVLNTVTWEGSFQMENLNYVVSESL